MIRKAELVFPGYSMIREVVDDSIMDVLSSASRWLIIGSPELSSYR